MTFGHMSDAQCAEVVPVVKDRVIHDLGAGDLGMAHLLVELGAKHVVAVDRAESIAVKALKPDGPIEFHRMDHDAYVSQGMRDRYEMVSAPSPRFAQPQKPDVVFMSWPFNMPDSGLLLLASMAKSVIYLGSNWGGTACGFPDLFEHFVTRELVAHIPERPNTLIVLGAQLEWPREPTQEEMGGMDLERIYMF